MSYGIDRYGRPQEEQGGGYQGGGDYSQQNYGSGQGGQDYQTYTTPSQHTQQQQPQQQQQSALPPTNPNQPWTNPNATYTGYTPGQSPSPQQNERETQQQRYDQGVNQQTQQSQQQNASDGAWKQPGGTGLQQAGGGMAFAGFNDSRALSNGDPNSTKDAFRRIVGSLGLNLAGMSKDQVGQALASYVIPALNANGVEARPGNGQDTIWVKTKERGWEEVDIVGAAGSADAQWVWGDLAGGWGGTPSQPQGITPGAGAGQPGVNSNGTVNPAGNTTPNSNYITPTAPGQFKLPDMPSFNFSAYAPGAAPDAAYGSYENAQIGQYAAPGQTRTQQLSDQAMQDYLQQRGFDERWAEQAKAQDMEKQQQLYLQGLQQQQEAAAASGMAGSGANLALQQRAQDAMRADVVRGQRDLEIDRVKNQADFRSGQAKAGNEYMTGVAKRAQDNYNTQLGGEKAQLAYNQDVVDSRNKAADFAWKQYLDQELMKQQQFSSNAALGSLGLDTWNSQAQMANAEQQRQLDRYLAELGLNLDYKKEEGVNDRFGLSHQLATKEFEDSMKQWRADLQQRYAAGGLAANQTLLGSL